ncbi:tetratricopeptide repeat protein [Maribacter sp. 2210JD10-5]|uniref:tetratricopeptide repeat protein n=1 Tax=Maribacter sp. 2210JD10-5 TaxID=3386272 RepID=UPI0039BD36A8
MKKYIFFLVMAIGMLYPVTCLAQEENELNVEQSAEVFLEAYSDAFQENFFEALKQKGIQNYDKSINYLLECKQLEPENLAVSHELARTYLLDKKYIQGQEYAIEAVNGAPQNYWYLNTLNDLVIAQKAEMDLLTERIPWENMKLKENLAKIYFEKKEYESALALLKKLQNTNNIASLRQRIEDSIADKEKQKKTTSFTVTRSESNEILTMEHYKTRLKGMLMMKNGNALVLQVSEEALENYPLQPYFYYTNGYALNRAKKYRKAIEVLESALDYLVNDISLGNKIYQELANAYNAISNPSKANMYLSKVKPGF